MNRCILCQSIITSSLLFADLFFMVKNEEYLCSTCRLSFRKIDKNCCPSCQKSGSSELCSDCMLWQERGHPICHTALYQYEKNMADYFVRYKQWGDYQLRFAFSKEVKESLRKWKGYSVVPIPVSESRFNERGFNQVEGFLEAAGICYHPILKKAEVEHQIGKGRLERLAMEQVFELKQSLKVSKGVLLVDDVYTTGATLEQAKKIIYENVCQNVFTFSIAR